MSARDFMRWVRFSLTGRIPGGWTAPGKRVASPDEAEALGLTTAPCSHPHADDTGIRGLLEHVGVDTSGGITVAGREIAPPREAEPSGWLTTSEVVQELVHLIPQPGKGVTGCCGRTPFELPRTDRMTAFAYAVTCRGDTVTADCERCGGPVDWVDCPTGGWWAHRLHPADGHDAAPPLRARYTVAIRSELDEEPRPVTAEQLAQAVMEVNEASTCDASAVIDLVGTRQSFGPCIKRERHKGWHEDATGASWKERDDAVTVPRDALRGLVEVAEYVSNGSFYNAAGTEPYPDAKAQRALAALDDAGLLDQFREGGDG